MTDSTKIILIIGGLLIIMAYVLLYTPLADLLFVPKPRIPQPMRPSIMVTKPLPAPATLEAAPKPASGEAMEKSAATGEAIVPKFMTLRDPFEVGFSYARAEGISATGTSPQEKTEPPKYLTLQGIFVSGKVKTAIIDDKVVSVGSKTTAGFRVFDIRADQVVLKKAGKIKILRIK